LTFSVIQEIKVNYRLNAYCFPLPLNQDSALLRSEYT
jgi:hypothetical protein